VIEMHGAEGTASEACCAAARKVNAFEGASLVSSSKQAGVTGRVWRAADGSVNVGPGTWGCAEALQGRCGWRRCGVRGGLVLGCAACPAGVRHASHVVYAARHGTVQISRYCAVPPVPCGEPVTIDWASPRNTVWPEGGTD
jgi:hypothetical protein